MIQLKRLGHILLRVADLEQSKAFYSDILGFEIVEEDPNHGGVFMSLGEHGHTLDLMPADGPAPARLSPQQVGLQHFAFQVDSFEDLKDAYFTLQDHGIEEVSRTSGRLTTSVKKAFTSRIRMAIPWKFTTSCPMRSPCSAKGATTATTLLPLNASISFRSRRCDASGKDAVPG